MDLSTTTKMNSQKPQTHELTRASKLLNNKPVHDANKNDLIKKILCLIDDYASGVFEHQLPVYYKQRYNEKLPESWVNLIDQMDLKKEPSVGSFIIITRKVF